MYFRIQDFGFDQNSSFFLITEKSVWRKIIAEPFLSSAPKFTIHFSFSLSVSWLFRTLLKVQEKEKKIPVLNG
jgi:hypothetical protein